MMERAADAYQQLADLAESVEDEWQYVNDLVGAYLPAIRALPSGVSAEQAAAVDEAIAEIGLIEDPHRAIDWLSTFPHVIAIALGGDVDAEAGDDDRARTATDEPDDDNPFRLLLGGRGGGR